MSCKLGGVKGLYADRGEEMNKPDGTLNEGIHSSMQSGVATLVLPLHLYWG